MDGEANRRFERSGLTISSYTAITEYFAATVVEPGTCAGLSNAGSMTTTLRGLLLSMLQRS